MPVHPQAQMFLDQTEGQPAPYEMSVADARAMMDGFNALAGGPQAVASVDDRDIPGPGGPMRIRVYRPAGTTDADARSARDGVLPRGRVRDGKPREPRFAVPRARERRRPAWSSRSTTGARPSTSSPPRPRTRSRRVQWVAAHGAEIGADGTRLAVVGDSVGGGLATIDVDHGARRRRPARCGSR